MSYVEAGFIKRNVYDALEEERLQGHELYPGELCVAMFALAANAQRKEAAKLPMEITDVVERDSGLHVATLGLVNRRRTEIGKTFVGQFRDGYWVDVESCMVVTTSAVRYKTTEGYVRSYDPHVDSDLGMQVEEGSADITMADFEAVMQQEMLV